MKVLSVFGTRPEAIKMAPIIRELHDRASENIESVVCVTAQHRQMLDQVTDLFGILPDYDLDIMADNQTPTQVAASVLQRMEPILHEQKPDWVLVQGDTTTVAATAFAAYYAHVRLGHIEAGLRTFDKWQPFPEELNRRAASVFADLHFAPTERSRRNLLAEGVPATSVLVTGNPVVDALQWVAALPFAPSLSGLDPNLFAPIRPRLLLVTAHRRENFGRPLENICMALRDLARHYGDTIHIVYPVHLNPNVQEPVYRLLGNISGVTLTEPLPYLTLVHLMKHAYFVLTDSGGIQEEAPGLGKPVLVLREVTERPEAVDAGTVRVVGTDRAMIVAQAMELLDNPAAYQRMALAINPYGDGHAAPRIVDALVEFGNRC